MAAELPDPSYRHICIGNDLKGEPSEVLHGLTLQIARADTAVWTESSHIDFLSTLRILYQWRQQLALWWLSKLARCSDNIEHATVNKQHTRVERVTSD